MNGIFANEITVLGIGNVILSDEGFGVRVIEHLQKNFSFPANVSLIDGGTLGIELTEFITGTQKLLIIDSINGGQKSGTIFKFVGDEIKNHFNEKISAHEIGIQDVLTSLEITNKKIPEVVVIGVQPFSLDAGINLTVQMKKFLPLVSDMAIKILNDWNVSVKKF